MGILKKLIKKADLFGRRVNLRFEGEDYFKTYCGAVATIFLFVTLMIITTVSVMDITKGKIESMNYMIKNTLVSTKSHFNDRNEVFGFAIEDGALDESLLKFEIGIGKRGEELNKSVESYNCKEEVYSKLSIRFSKSVPKNLSILCFNVPSNLLRGGYKPTVMFRECLDTNKGCKPLKIRDKLLREFYVWAFTIADETDFTQPKSTLNSKFSASLISVSNWYFKRATLVLREVELQTKAGIFMKKLSKKFTNIFLRTDVDIVSINKEEENMLELRLMQDEASKVVIMKKFQSISDLLAFLGGYSQGMMILLLIFVFPVREISYYRKLINSMFSVCQNQKQLETAVKIFAAGDDDNSEEALSSKSTRIGKAIKNGREKVNVYNNIKKMGVRFNKKRRKTRGALDQMMEAREHITKEKFLENMQKAFSHKDTLNKMKEENVNPKTPKDNKKLSFANLILAGMGKYFKKKSKRETISSLLVENEEKVSRGTQTFNITDNFVDGKMRDLNVYEIDNIQSEVILKGLTNWVKLARKMLKEKKELGDNKKFEKRRYARIKTEYVEFEAERNKSKNFKTLIGGILKSPRPGSPKRTIIMEDEHLEEEGIIKIQEVLEKNDDQVREKKRKKSNFYISKEKNLEKKNILDSQNSEITEKNGTLKAKKFFGFKPNTAKIKHKSCKNINLEGEDSIDKLCPTPSFPKRKRENKSKTFIRGISKSSNKKMGALLDKFEVKKTPSETGGFPETFSSCISDEEESPEKIKDEEAGDNSKSNKHSPYLNTERPLISMPEILEEQENPIESVPKTRMKLKKILLKNLTKPMEEVPQDRTSIDEKEHEETEKKLQKLQNKTEKMFQKSRDLKFQVGIMDYFRLFLPSIFDKDYTKKDLFLKVYFFDYFF